MSHEENQVQALVKEAEALTQQLKSAKLQEEEEYIDGVLEQIDLPIKQVPENVFREIFLPYFIGAKPTSEEEDAFAHWAGLVGSFTMSAEVVDPTGKVLFTVPPLADSSVLNTFLTKDDRDTISQAYDDYVNVASTLPGDVSKNILHGQLSKSLDRIIQGTADLRKWDGMLRYYKLIPEDDAAAPTAATTAISGLSTLTDDDVSFD